MRPETNSDADDLNNDSKINVATSSSDKDLGSMLKKLTADVRCIKGKGKGGKFGKGGRQRFAEKGKGKGKRGKFTCNYCKKPGHFYAECRKRIKDEKGKKKSI